MENRTDGLNTDAPNAPLSDPWEAAYLRFETPQQEIRMTPFLRFVHAVSENPVARRLSNRIDALATMIQFERRTYEQWLGQPELFQKIARAHFVPVHESFAWGKWNLAGAPR